MDHKRFIASLPPETRAALHETSDRAGLTRLALHWAAILLVGAAIFMEAPGWQVLIVIQGVLLVFCFTLLHETTHATPFRTRRVNEAVMCVCGLLILLPPHWFRYFHFAHHKFTNDPERDPELSDGGGPVTWAGYFWTLTGAPVWRSHVTQILRNAARVDPGAFLPCTKRSLVVWEARAMLGAYTVAGAAMASGQSWLFWCWLLPMVAGQPFLRLYLMAEHGRCPAVANMLENSRTTMTNRLVRLIAWNMPFHAEHHAMPNVPFYRLPELHRLTKPHLKSVSSGYGAFHRSYVAAFPPR